MSDSPRTRRPRLPGLEIRPGTVRAARKAAGLTLAQLAGTDISKAAIHLIETGRSRPSLPTLKLIARRTHKPLSYFLVETGETSRTATRARAQVIELEELCAAGQFAAAVELGVRLLPELVEARDEAQARLCLGQSLVELKDPESAARHLTAARPLFEELNDDWQLAECLSWEAAAHQLRADPYALEVAEEALRRCRLLDPVPIATELRILANLVAICAARQAWDRAIAHCEEAIEAADSVQDVGRMAAMHSALAAAYRGRGELSMAIRYSNRALALHSMASEGTARARLENSLGLLHLRQGRLDEAELHFDSSLKRFEDRGHEAGRVDLLLNLSELHLRRGDAARAQEHVRTAMDLARRAGDQLSLGRGHMLRGRLQERNRLRAKADRSFATAIGMLTELGATELLIACHAAYAEILEQRGSTGEALEHWKQAMALTRQAR